MVLFYLHAVASLGLMPGLLSSVLNSCWTYFVASDLSADAKHAEHPELKWSTLQGIRTNGPGLIHKHSSGKWHFQDLAVIVKKGLITHLQRFFKLCIVALSYLHSVRGKIWMTCLIYSLVKAMERGTLIFRPCYLVLHMRGEQKCFVTDYKQQFYCFSFLLFFLELLFGWIWSGELIPCVPAVCKLQLRCN